MRKLSSLKLTASLLSAFLLGGCALAPAAPHQVASVAMPAATKGVLSTYGERIAAELDAGRSAYWLLDDADFAFEARLSLVDHAEESLDIQYFIWEPDPTGRLLASRLVAAADRGVRVRLLLDDLTTAKRDWEYIALAEHPRIEVRSFNPWKLRSRLMRFAQFAINFDKLNHRMHHKTIVADGHFAMIGGRNVGDRYFGVYDEFVQNDLDVMTLGPMVEKLAESFDVYWNSPSSYPIGVIGKPGRRRVGLGELMARFEDEYMDGRDKLAMYPLEPTDWRAFLDELAERYRSARGELCYDAPDADEDSPRVVYERFLEFISSARERLIVSTAYLIPEPALLELFDELVARGVEVSVLTNSLATNNHLIAHTAYRRWRRRLLDTGIELYELREDAQSKRMYSLPPTDAGWLGLHTKAAVVDGRYSFIGSPNVDPRSMKINTEIGLFLESAELAAELTALLERDLAPRNSWRVTKDEEGWLYWTNDEEVVERQPAKGFKQRFMEFFINLLPLKKQA